MNANTSKEKNYNIKKVNDFTYSIEIYGEYKLPLYKTINNVLKSSFFSDETKTIIFSAEKIETLKDYLLVQPNQTMSQEKCIKMIDELTKQIMYLKKLQYGFYGFDINDILVIDETTFILCSSNYLLPIERDNKHIFFYSPINYPYFLDPKLFQLTTLPSSIHFKCSYYSLGVLILFCLLNNYLLVGNEIKSQAEIENILYPLRNTKIYWFLKRCFETDIDKRVLLLI
jgi:hypothetical protein